VLVIDILDAQGQPERLGWPLYDALIGDAEATWALVIGSLRLLGAAHAEVADFSVLRSEIEMTRSSV
jgi:hypothetical protein